MKLILAFALMSLGMVLPSAFASTASVTVNGVTHDVEYEATNLAVDDLSADTSTATISIIVTTEVTDGTLSITFDRSFFDSKTGDADDEFLVLLDGGQDVTPIEEKTDTSRTLTITVPSGTNSVDIVSLGTTNFGSGTPAETPVEAPTETPTETPTEEPVTTPEPTIQCGEGTVFDEQSNSCIVVQTEQEPPATPEVPAQVEEPTDQTPVQECGTGTVLKDGQCVLDETCGAGTILQDGQCVVDNATSTPSGGGTQFIAALVAGFVIAFVIMIILWAIGKAGRSKN